MRGHVSPFPLQPQTSRRPKPSGSAQLTEEKSSRRNGRIVPFTGVILDWTARSANSGQRFFGGEWEGVIPLMDARLDGSNMRTRG